MPFTTSARIRFFLFSRTLLLGSVELLLLEAWGTIIAQCMMHGIIITIVYITNTL